MAGDRKRAPSASRPQEPRAESARTRARKSASTAVPSPSALRPDVFRERLDSLESLVDDAVREAGAEAELTSDDAPWLRAADRALNLYARLARLLDEGSVAQALSGLGLGRRDRRKDFGYDADFEGALGPLLEFLFTSWWRVEAVGVRRVPDDGPVLLVANSAGALLAYDAVMLRLAVQRRHPRRRNPRPLLEPEVCDLPILGEVLARCGGVPASEADADALLQRNEVVVCFPEGRAAFGKPYRRRYRIGDFHEQGFVRAALRRGAPILPVAIVGAEDTQPVLGRLDWLARRIGVPSVPLTPTFPWLGVGGLLPLPSRWRIEVGRPLSGLDHLGSEAASDGDRIRAVHQRLHRRLQTLLNRAVRRRGRPYL